MQFRPYSGIMWLASYPRSGNTWTRVFLYNISRVVAGMRGPADLTDVVRFAPWDIGIYPGLDDAHPLAGLSRQQIAELRPKWQAMVAGRRKGFTLLKTHAVRALDCGVPIINADATGGAIYVVRNPLDVVVSYAKHMGISLGRAIAWMEMSGWTSAANEKQTHEVIGSWSENVSSWTGPSKFRVFVFRYEDALAHPAEVFGKLARFVGLTPDNIQLGLAIEYSAFTRLKQQERETGFHERSRGSDSHFRAGEANSWRDLLTDRQIERIIRSHGEQMRRFGYLPK